MTAPHAFDELLPYWLPPFSSVQIKSGRLRTLESSLKTLFHLRARRVAELEPLECESGQSSRVRALHKWDLMPSSSGVVAGVDETMLGQQYGVSLPYEAEFADLDGISEIMETRIQE